MNGINVRSMQLVTEVEDKFRRRLTITFVLISLGVLLASSCGSWDITNHLLSRPETFFSAPHAGLYTGVALVLFGLVSLLHCYRSYDRVLAKPTNVKQVNSRSSFPLSVKLVVIGVSMLVVAGPFDFAWHSAFGLDGLLSPSHVILAMGMLLSSMGSFTGILSVNSAVALKHERSRLKSITESASPKLNLRNSEGHKPSSAIVIIIGIVPLWITLAGLTYMFSLPFSNTEHFKFNPDPTSAALIATIAFPFITSFILLSSFRLTRKFGVLSITGILFVIINLATSIVPNEYLHSTIPFYILNVIPIVAADTLLSNLSLTNKRSIYVISGAILGLTFFMLYYPLITHIYNEILPKPQPVWPTMTSAIYFGMIPKVYPWVAIPAMTAGILAAIFSKFNKSQGVTRIFSTLRR